VLPTNGVVHAVEPPNAFLSNPNFKYTPMRPIDIVVIERVEVDTGRVLPSAMDHNRDTPRLKNRQFPCLRWKDDLTFEALNGAPYRQP
jgi:hypothetical protein